MWYSMGTSRTCSQGYGMFSSSFMTVWGTYLRAPRCTHLLFPNLRLLISPWSLMIFRTCSGGRSWLNIRIQALPRQTAWLTCLLISTNPPFRFSPYCFWIHFCDLCVSTSGGIEPELWPIDGIPGGGAIPGGSTGIPGGGGGRIPAIVKGVWWQLDDSKFRISYGHLHCHHTLASSALMYGPSLR